MNGVVQFVAGGGWFTRQALVRPKARFFTYVAVLWPLVPVLGTWLVFLGSSGDVLPSFWLPVALALPEPIFIILAVVFWFAEEARSVEVREPNPDFDLRKLY
jgi:hypothetical protein